MDSARMRISFYCHSTYMHISGWSQTENICVVRSLHYHYYCDCLFLSHEFVFAANSNTNCEAHTHMSIPTFHHHRSDRSTSASDGGSGDWVQEIGSSSMKENKIKRINILNPNKRNELCKRKPKFKPFSSLWMRLCVCMCADENNCIVFAVCRWARLYGCVCRVRESGKYVNLL